MPNDFDRWLSETYGDATPYDANSPVPDEVNQYAPPAGVDADISQFVDNSAGLGTSVVPGLPTPPPLQSASQSASVATSGANLSDAKSAAIERATGPMEKAIAKSDAEITAEADQTAADLARVKELDQANASRRSQLDAELATERQKYAEEEDQVLRDQIFSEKLAAHQDAQKEEEAMANWASAVKAYEATNINPGKLWNDMSGGSKFATAISVFAANVLASKGIDTTVMSSLNKAIDDNINTQLSNLDKKGKSAGMFKQMWDAVRADSESNAEARVKMRSLMMSEFKSGVTAKLMAFDSDYAKLKGQEVYANLEGEEAKNLAALRQQKRLNLENGREFARKVQRDKNDLRMEQARLALSAREVALAEAKAAPAPEPVDESDYVVDGTPGGEGRALKWLPGIKDAEREKGRLALQEEEQITKDLIEYQKLAAELGGYYDGPLKNVSTGRDKKSYELYQKMNNVRERLKLKFVNKIAATTFTDALVKRVEPLFGENTWTKGTGRSVAQAIGSLLIDAKREGDAWRRQHFTYERDPRIVAAVTKNRAGNDPQAENFSTEVGGLGKELYDSIPSVETPIQKLAARARTSEVGRKEISGKDQDDVNFLTTTYQSVIDNGSEVYSGKHTKGFADIGRIAEVAWSSTDPQEIAEAKATLKILETKEYLGGIRIDSTTAKEAEYWNYVLDDIETARTKAQWGNPEPSKFQGNQVDDYLQNQ